MRVSQIRALTPMSLDEKQACYQALMVDRTVRNGITLMGVTSTGIFCQPGCPARQPKLENCVFFKTANEAEAAGFRACKRCKPV